MLLVAALTTASACAPPPSSSPAATVSPVPATALATVQVTMSAPSPSPTQAARYELVAELQGTTGPAGLAPAGGEITCRGRVVVTIDMRARPPLGLVTAYFDIEVQSCREGTVLTDAHVHAVTVPGHPDRIYIGAGVTRPIPLTGGLVTTTNQGVDPRAAAEVVADPGQFGFFLHTGPELRGYQVSPFDWDFSTFSPARIHRSGR